MEMRTPPLVAFVCILLVMIILVGGVYFLNSSYPELLKFFDSSSQESPSGSIYLSLNPVPYDKNPIGIYAFDSVNQTLKDYIPANPTEQKEYLTSKISPDGSKIAFAALYAGGEPRLFVRNADGTNEREIAELSGLQIKRSPVWSPDGSRIAFWGKSDFNGSDLAPENWEVHEVDVEDNSTRFVTNGAHPFYTPLGDLVIMKNDGLYVFETVGDEEVKKIWGATDGPAMANMMTAISPQGNLLAWATPFEGKLYLMRVTSWEPFTWSGIDTIPIHGFWPVFSPDGKWVALEEVLWSGDDDPTEPRLVIYNTKTLKKFSSFDLSNYYQLAMFITDWR